MRTLPTLLVLVSLALPAPAAPAQFFGPEVLASIGDDPPLGGSGETFNPYPFAGLVLKTSTAEDRAILEFDLTSLVGKTLTSAQLEGEINANTAADAGLRTFEFTLYPGNGSADLADYQAPGTVLGTGSYHPPNELAFEFAFDVAGALQPLLDAGTPFVGLRVRSTAGGPGASDTLAAYTHLLVQTLEPATVPGWTAQTGENHFASPKLADVDGDGLEDVVQTTSAQAGGAGTLRVWRGDGSPAPGFPVPLPSVSIATPAVGDVDGDGDPEIFVGLLNAVTAYDHTGLPVPGLSQGWSPRGFLLADIDGDGKLELVLGRTSGSLHAYEHDGTLKTTYSIPGSSKTSIPAVGDIDLDGDLEVLAGGQGSLAVWQDDATPLAGFPAAVCGDGTSAPLVADLDLDGSLDVTWRDGGRLEVLQALGLPEQRRTGAELLGPAAADASGCVAADTEGELSLDVFTAENGGLRFRESQYPENRAVRLALRGVKDNRRGVGAVVELLAGPLYRRIFWRGEALTIGIGPQEQVDVVRVTWPNGVVQHVTELRARSHRLIVQKEGLVGSCPFLYTWNGETYAFITDVLGITPLGLPMAPGRLVPPDHDEYVLVRGEELVPRDGFYELQVTEELREVTYLDRVRLEVVDHPAGTEVLPDERFTFPPFPAPHTHTLASFAELERATGSDGGDWTAELRATDGSFAAPFEPYGGQMLGLAPAHHLELQFDREAVRTAEKLRLVLCGWFYWTDASVNVAAARTPGIDFVPPVLEVPDGSGGWKPAGPPVGFPAGKTKSMVIDVTELLDRDDPRLRIGSTLRLYWDSIRLATDGDDAPLRVHALEPVSAELWERGYSEPVVLHPEHGLEWFEWELRASNPRWDQHPGLYTRYGDVLELLGAIDDRFVILGAGDALTVRFDAGEAPPLPEGWRRDFLVFFDGWAKDRDPNTVEALGVEPLPFHGMSGYPYGPDERFPADEEHEAWRREWNTRPARRWIEPLAPRAE